MQNKIRLIRSKGIAVLSVLFILSSLVPAVSLAQLAEPDPIPAGLGKEWRQELNDLRSDLEKTRRRLNTEVKLFEIKCTKVNTKDTALVKKCGQWQKEIQPQIYKYDAMLASYKNARRRAVSAANRIVGTERGSRGSAPVDLSFLELDGPGIEKGGPGSAPVDLRFTDPDKPLVIHPQDMKQGMVLTQRELDAMKGDEGLERLPLPLSNPLGSDEDMKKRVREWAEGSLRPKKLPGYWKDEWKEAAEEVFEERSKRNPPPRLNRSMTKEEKMDKIRIWARRTEQPKKLPDNWTYEEKRAAEVVFRKKELAEDVLEQIRKRDR